MGGLALGRAPRRSPADRLASSGRGAPPRGRRAVASWSLPTTSCSPGRSRRRARCCACLPPRTSCTSPSRERRWATPSCCARRRRWPARSADRLRRAGVAVATHPADWARGAAGATVVGTRAAAWAPVGDLGCVVVLDEHDEAHQQQQAPTWHARDVAIERAQRAGVPCVLTSPCPTLEALGWGELHAADRTRDRVGLAGGRGGGPARGGPAPRSPLRSAGSEAPRRRPRRCASSTARAGPSSWRAEPAASWRAARCATPLCTSQRTSWCALGAAPADPRCARCAARAASATPGPGWHGCGRSWRR